MRAARILILTFTVLLISLGCVDKQLELEQLASAFPEIPVVPIMFPTGGVFSFNGSATVIGDRDLLLSPHELPPHDSGPILVDNCLWIYTITRRVDGPTEASGWAIIRLAKLSDYSRGQLKQIPILAERTDEELDGLLDAESRFQCELPQIPESVKFDFERKIPWRQSVAIAYTQTGLNGNKLRYYDPDLRYEREFRIGCAYMPLFCTDARVAEFFPIKTRQSIPHGASGSPVYIMEDDYEAAVIVGIYGGKVIFEEPFEITIGLVRRPHELTLPLKRR